jgi:hypothetical protein
VKTQIIQLDPKDDYISVRDKLSWSQARRILLVWPPNGYALQRKLDLNLVQRLADQQGAQIALVTHEPQIRFYASQLDIPVFSTARLAQEAQWSHYQVAAKGLASHTRRDLLEKMKSSLHSTKPAWPDRPITRVLCLVASALAIFSLVVTLLPSARVSVSPKVDTQSMLFDVIADPSISLINISTGSLPTYPMEVTIEGSDYLPTTGSVLVPARAASGSLLFTNISDHPVTIPAGTIVSTENNNPVQYITANSSETHLDVGETVLLVAQAMSVGSSGNLTEDELVKIEGILGQELVVTNPQATSGGREELVPGATSQDLANLRKRLIDHLLQAAEDHLRSNLSEGDYLITPSVDDVETLEESVFPAVGQPGNQLELTLRIRVQGQVVSATSLHSMINPIMDAYTPAGYAYVEGSLEVSPYSQPSSLGQGRYGWSILATRRLRANISTERAVQLVVGKSKAQASAQLASTLPINLPAQIDLSPSWWPRMPFLGMRIELSTEGIQ